MTKRNGTSQVTLLKSRLPPDFGAGDPLSPAELVAWDAIRLQGIIEVLTHDSHFKQKGFAILL